MLLDGVADLDGSTKTGKHTGRGSNSGQAMVKLDYAVNTTPMTSYVSTQPEGFC